MLLGHVLPCWPYSHVGDGEIQLIIQDLVFVREVSRENCLRVVNERREGEGIYLPGYT